MNQLLPALFLLLLSLASNAQIIDQSCLGGTNTELLNNMVASYDGGFLLCGYTMSDDGDVSMNHAPGSKDFWVVKIDADLNIEWERSYGGSGDDEAYAVVPNIDGSYIIAGQSASADGDVTGHHGDAAVPDMWVVKVTSDGTLDWEKSYGGTNIDAARNMISTYGGGYLLTGFTWSNDGDVDSVEGMSDLWLVKITSVGTLEWSATYGGSMADAGYAVKQGEFGEYYIAGNSFSNDGDLNFHQGSNTTSDVWVLMTSEAGDIEWQRTFGGTETDEARDMTFTMDGNLLVVGDTWSDDGDVSVQHGNGDFWILQLASYGEFSWEKTYGGSATEYAQYINYGGDRLFVGGFSKSLDGDVNDHHGTEFNSDAWIIETTVWGDLINEKSYGGTLDDVAVAAFPMTPGDCIFAGYTESTDGDVTGLHGNNDYWIFRAPYYLSLQEDAINHQIALSPNPCSQSLNINIADLTHATDANIFDIDGKLILSQSIIAPHSVINIQTIPSGVYYVRAGNYSAGFVKE